MTQHQRGLSKSKYNAKSQSLIKFSSLKDENAGWEYLCRLMSWNAGLGITYIKDKQVLIPYMWESALKYFKVKFKVVRRYV